MKTAKLPLIVAFLLSLISISSCSEDCQDGLFEIRDVSLEPRRWFPGEGVDETEPWDNADQFPIVVLKMEIKMDKFFRTLPVFEGNCFPKYLIDKKVRDVKVFSNQSFGEIGPLQDLSSIVLFSPRAGTPFGQFIEKREWLDFYVNESNFTRTYFVFNRNPELQALHSIFMVFEFEDGSSIQTERVDVLLTPAVIRQ
ncbi:hypothetical protein [Cecembia lonarensis]|uniref:Lipoprotein n=1 Tax=Cecembia lonarensis (strain CCUG 58316 / KCTC 22772 / LW9) TaxID=1225176 RepID=K1L0R9_CECL9|nr:hypothetical protein [Cecembia lonarensis]EKB48366.1 hypothetical protein B879_03002 [Cecembia lonarensis LW9]